MLILEYLFLVLISILIRFDIDFRSFIREVGLELSDNKFASGYQDAISPPKLTWLSIVCYLIFFGTIISLFFYKSVILGIFCIFIVLIIQVITGTIIHPPRKTRIFEKFYLRILYSSMVNRYADYKKENDNVRANAINILIKKFENKFTIELND